MASFLIDEDLPRSLKPQLEAAGLKAEDVRDIGLRHTPDEKIFASAVAQGQVLISADLGFANLLRFPLGSHAGIVVARFSNETPTSVLNQAILQALQMLTEEDLAGNLIIVEPGRIRLRKQ